MRDPKRIDRMLELLAKYWHAEPDLRLGQIVGNFTPRIPQEKGTSCGVGHAVNAGRWVCCTRESQHDGPHRYDLDRDDIVEWEAPHPTEPGYPYYVEDDVIEAALQAAIAGLDFKPLPPRHPSPCISHKTGTCVWLRDGTKVVIKRHEETTGRAWLEVEQQAVVHLAEGDK